MENSYKKLIHDKMLSKLLKVDYCSEGESKKIIEKLNKMTKDELKVTKTKIITLKIRNLTIC
ncbi:hypothetical protein PKF05_06095 [Fusobacterium simiae]|uniref:Uncharacterized protein n=1 Tax=Fusobacterium simiae TaxID=855 RepID=A0ABT4DIT6_FUSSI|nr:hypothetical protein [Fusobacterium simiae]MCY7008519.1 hypothetical protein [Fusobacterium simiae]MDC7955395.1 hypothetical protein [Fusobacterium simiae]